MIALLFAAYLNTRLQKRKLAHQRFVPKATGITLLFLTLMLAAPIDHAAAQFQLGQRIRAMVPSRPTPVESTNFIVYAEDQVLAQKVAREAERFRRELAIEWIGEEMPTWQQKCPIKVKLERNAGGQTSFAFVFNDPSNQAKGVPTDWEMEIFGPPDRILDAVLPHEITHTIFATHFGRPLPRWADEGACTTVEHESERNKNHQMLIQFLTSSPSRGIPFNRMFTMKNYPQDILPLYAQGYSLAKFLIFQKGRRHFLDFVARGLEYEELVAQGRMASTLGAWNTATNEFYNFDDLSNLQIAWQSWVQDGSQKNDIAKYTKAGAGQRTQTTAPYRFAARPGQLDTQRDAPGTYTRAPLNQNERGRVVSANANADSWYAQQMRRKKATSTSSTSDTIYR